MDAFHGANQPFICHREPDDPLKIVMRVYTFSPWTPMISMAYRAESEVASMFAVHESLRQNEPQERLEDAVPAVYAWKGVEADSDHAGWVMMEFKTGLMISNVLNYTIAPGYEELELSIFEQMAALLAGVQNADVEAQLARANSVPISVLGLSESLLLSNTPETARLSNLAYWKRKFRQALKRSEKAWQITGLGGTILRMRIQNFIDLGLEGLLEMSRWDRRVLIKGNFSK